jgi:hypothetical protein
MDPEPPADPEWETGFARPKESSDLAEMRFSRGLGSHLELRVDVAAIAAVVAGGSAAVAILTGAIAAVPIAVIGLAVMLATLREPSPWLTTSNDLTTLSLSDDDLDACLAAARRVGTGRNGSETEAALDSVTLVMPGRRWRAPDVPTVTFRAREPEARGWRTLAFDRPPPRPSPVEVGADGGHGIGTVTVPPWRLDASWRELVALSWMRMQPFVGTVILEPLPGSRGRRRYWKISYRSAESRHRGQTTSFRLRSTGLYRPASTSRARGGAAAVVGGP